MKIAAADCWLLSLGLLVLPSLASCAKKTKVQKFIYNPKRTEDTRDVFFTKLKDDPRDAIEARIVVEGYGPLEKNAKKCDGFFSLVSTPDQRVAVSNYIVDGAANSTVRVDNDDRFYKGGFTRPQVAARLKKISAASVGDCRSVDCCRLISDFINGIDKKALEALTPLCVAVIAGDIEDDRHPSGVKTLERLPASILSKHGSKLLGAATNNPARVDPEVMSKILSTDETCIAINNKQWQAILNTPKLAKTVTAECIGARPTSLEEVYATPVWLVEDAFILYNGPLASGLPKNMWIDQLKSFAGEFEDGENPGKYLSLNLLGRNAKGLSLRLILGRLYSRIDHNLYMKKTAWNYVPADIFSALQAEDAYVIGRGLVDWDESVSVKMQSHFLRDHVQDLSKHREICASLLPVAARKIMSISKACFEAMRPESQVAFMVAGGEAPDSTLEHVDADQVQKWEHKDAKGLQVLSFFSPRRANKERIVAHLGAALDYNHPCSLVTDLDSLKPVKILQHSMSSKCYQHMKWRPEEDDLKVLHPRLPYLASFAELKRKHPKKFWMEMRPDVMGWMISGGHFCGRVDAETFNALSRPALFAVTAGCFDQLRIVGKLSKATIQATPPSALVNARAEHVTGDFMAVLTPPQLALIGAENKDEKSSVASLFTVEVMQAYAPGHVAEIQAVHWKLITPKVFEAMTAERLQAIPPEKTLLWTVDQVKAMPQAVASTITPSQAEMISLSVTDPEQSAVGALLKLQLSQESRAVVERRAQEAGIKADDMQLSSILFMCLFAVVILAGVGGAVYFFIQRRE